MFGCRDAKHAASSHLVGESAFAYLTGPSGCGKTALAKRWLAESTGGRLWLDARDIRDGLLDFGARVRLRMAIQDVLRMGHAPVRIVVDGLDRTYGSQAHASTAELARVAATSDGTVHLLVTSQTFALDRVAAQIADANGPKGDTVIIGDLDDDDVAVVLGEWSDLHRLVHQGTLRTVLRRPKLLQVVLHAMEDSTSESFGHLGSEVDVADLWWERLALGTGVDRASRAELLLGLGTWTAESLAEGLPAGQLGAAGLGDYASAVASLRAEEILSSDEDVYAFGHDLFADWARYRTLGPWHSARGVMTEREKLPTWHRAVRLYALRTIGKEGIDRWRAEHDELRAAGNDIAADLYLDAVLFASDAESYIGELWEALAYERGKLLARMLNRFAHVASVPDPRGAMISSGDTSGMAIYFAATWRIPLWVLWPPVIRALHAHAAEVVELVPLPLARVVEPWLRLSPAGFVARKEAAELAYALGKFLDGARDRQIYLDEDDSVKIWEAFLAAAAELPEEVGAGVVAMLGNANDAEDDHLV